MRRAERVATVALLLALGAVARAWPPHLQPRIDALPAVQRAGLQARQSTLDAMTPAQRQAFVQRLATWDALPTAVRRERRERWQAWQGLPLEQQLQVRVAAAAYAALPVARQQALRRQFDALDGSDRHGWLLGPGLGADYAALQPLLAQLPLAQRDPMLAVLRMMTPAERFDLGVLAQRTPPQQRDALRRALLSTAADNRGAWLRLQLDR